MSDNYAFMKRYDIPDAYFQDRIYLRRWRIVQTPLFALYLHKVSMNDGDRDMHDHPYNFTSLILRGGYEEYVDKGDGEVLRRNWGAGSLHWMKGEWFHRITILNRTPTWTLLFVGRRRREWGFNTPDGWIPWETYVRNEKHDNQT